MGITWYIVSALEKIVFKIIYLVSGIFNFKATSHLEGKGNDDFRVPLLIGRPAIKIINWGKSVVFLHCS